MAPARPRRGGRGLEGPGAPLTSQLQALTDHVRVEQGGVKEQPQQRPPGHQLARGRVTSDERGRSRARRRRGGRGEVISSAGGGAPSSVGSGASASSRPSSPLGRGGGRRGGRLEGGGQRRGGVSQLERGAGFIWQIALHVQSALDARPHARTHGCGVSKLWDVVMVLLSRWRRRTGKASPQRSRPGSRARRRARRSRPRGGTLILEE